jgi:hypothetical protein
MNNDDGMDNNNDYGNEDYENDMGDGMGGNPNNLGGGGPGENMDDPEVDQYFDDAGDIGYLPADHVTIFIVLTNSIASYAKTSKRFD